VVPLKTRQVPPLEQQKPPVASPTVTGKRLRIVVIRAVRRRRKFDIHVVVCSELHVI
jgi:hypothetical protein